MVAVPVRWGIGKLAERAAAAAAAAAAATAANDAVKDKPDVRSREADCSDVPDHSECNQCLLGNGRVGQPPTPRYITLSTRINYDYQLQIANMFAGPERFGYVRRGDSADQIVSIGVEVVKGFFGKGGEYTTLEWLYGGTSFDGFWRDRCTVVEAKANFEKFFDEYGRDATPFTFAVTESWLKSYRVQSALVAPAMPRGKLEWHFMDVVAFIAGIEAGIPTESARHTPYVLGAI
ncbi:restriction endonuclease fold toxin 5 domain-containing protein [Stenotrophomonas maltophilia]|uniref:Tox-REase-5 domain-containing protein n=1 Tax=Stenotrophomonas maltophilia TaxID=40324 RepID=A0AAP7GVH5_STEMA|nr:MULTISPECIES: Tox-REase-5 domain-containing protein [Stenotrophomonas]MBE5270603.1 hypothetical protein [Stenotrophomonas sp. B2]MCO7398449.1 restriction endonuclease fold toxin 5 domain-containing protein [Stenotrophomonas maltophilia]MCO7410935.1 restriction endonuclease fold toxin 5 domain-containing protein [Stenotrophomonas maltophilia]MDI9249714.1 Tox-REase-5 domain-containing protein [Stenotrophomonas sp. RS-48]OBU63648.1 hypothetical protein A9K56_02835 [Stenotrophomonas maltophilia